VTYDELRRALARLGIRQLRHGARHDWYGDPNGERRTLIPRHRGEVPLGTLHKIVESLGLTLEDLRQGRQR